MAIRAADAGQRGNRNHRNCAGLVGWLQPPSALVSASEFRPATRSQPMGTGTLSANNAVAILIIVCVLLR
jgi:hypothetical protein